MPHHTQVRSRRRPGPGRPHRLPHRLPHPIGRGADDHRVLVDLRDAIAGAHDLDATTLRARPDAPVPAGTIDLLGAAPVRTAAEASARLDALARDLLERMRAAGWAEGAAPVAVTSVLAASVPAAEAVLLRVARSRGR